MVIVGVRELRQRASELIRLVREEGREVEITYRGEPVALLIPLSRAPAEAEAEDGWARLDRLAAEIGARWPEGVSAVDAVTEGRE